MSHAKINIQRTAVVLATMVAMLCLSICNSSSTFAQQKFKETRSKSQYTHYLPIYDSKGFQIKPDAESPNPYSPTQTCKKCHDYKSISHGYHFNAADILAYGKKSDAKTAAKDADKNAVANKQNHGRPGEPWILSNAGLGTQIPMSYRGWEGTYHPDDLDVSRFDFTKYFAAHTPGGGAGERVPLTASKEGDSKETKTATNPKWKSRGNLEIDCMMCHGGDRKYSHAKYIDAVNSENFAWAPSIALGLAKVDGTASRVPADYDPEKIAEGETSKLPKTKYKSTKFDSEHMVFFDVIRKPSNNSCFMCHSTKPVGELSKPKWTHEQDIHVRAGMNCSDCHTNGIGHNTVRGFAGEQHPTSQKVDTLSCAGCHLDQKDASSPAEMGGRFASPKPLHKGIPPVHFDKMSCTSCHSGPIPTDTVQHVQTAMAHNFGKATQTRTDDDIPGIVQPVFLKNANGVLHPNRMMWPAFFGWKDGDSIKPMLPEHMVTTMRQRSSPFRPSRNFREDASKYRPSKADRIEAIGEEDAKNKDDELTEKVKAKLDAYISKRRKENFDATLGRILAFMQYRRDEEMKTMEAYQAAQAELKKATPPTPTSTPNPKEATDNATDNAAATPVTPTPAATPAKPAPPKPMASQAAIAVYVSGGVVYKLTDGLEIPAAKSLRKAEGLTLETINDHPAAKPYAWPLAHEVRSARQALGVTGCTECHSKGAPLFYGQVAAVGPAPTDEPITVAMHELFIAPDDVLLMESWEQSFQGRPLFKWIGFFTIGVVLTHRPARRAAPTQWHFESSSRQVKSKRVNFQMSAFVLKHTF